MSNKWLQHLAKFREKNGEVKPQDMMRLARKSYQNGGKVEVVTHPVAAEVKANLSQPKLLKGGNVVPYEPTGTDSMPSKVGGKRRTKRQSRKSRRTRRR
jgi:hypothetical protein